MVETVVGAVVETVVGAVVKTIVGAIVETIVLGQSRWLRLWLRL